MVGEIVGKVCRVGCLDGQHVCGVCECVQRELCSKREIHFLFPDTPEKKFKRWLLERERYSWCGWGVDVDG